MSKQAQKYNFAPATMGALALKDLPELIDETRLMEWYFSFFHQDDARCFHCGETLSEKSTRTFLDGRRASCATCRNNNQIFKGTPLQGARTSPAQVLVLAILFDLGLTPKEISTLTGFPAAVARQWQHKLYPANAS